MKLGHANRSLVFSAMSLRENYTETTMETLMPYNMFLNVESGGAQHIHVW
jgi:hypothetical protein